MPENSRWHLTDFQRLLVVLAVACAIFLSAIALGAQSIIPLLVAMVLIVGAGLGVFLLGLRFTGRGTVQGHAYVIMAQPPPVGKIVGRCDMRLLVDMPGQSQNMVKLRDPSVPVTKWPTVGMTLPVEVSPRNPRQLRIRWELVDAHTLRTTTPAEPEDDLTVPFFTQYSDSELRGLTDGLPSATSDGPLLDSLDDYPQPAAATRSSEGRSSDIGSSEARASDTRSSELGAAEVAPSAATPAEAVASDERLSDARPSSDPRPETILGDEIIIPPHLSADLSPEASARASDFELPMRNIPQPRPAESLAERRGPTPPPAHANGQSAAEPGPDEDGPGMGMMLVVSDLTRSLRFYRDLVGFAMVDRGANLAVLEYGGGRVLLRQLADMSPVDRRLAHLHITVPDVDASYKDLKDRGVEFVHRPRVTSRGEKLDLWAATFRDPDGHDIALTQWRTREDA